MQKDKILNYQSDYISLLKHDFAVPVIAQIRALELLGNETIGKLNVEQKEIVATTLESCQEMYNMVSDILYSYELEKHKTKLNKSNIDIVKLLKESFIAENNRYLRKKLNIKVNCTDKICELNCDKEKIAQALKYILDYCFSTVSDNAFIVCNLIFDKKCINFSIMFESPFIANDKLTKIGNNLRLNLAKNIIKAHKGKLSAEICYPLNVIDVRLKG